MRSLATACIILGLTVATQAQSPTTRIRGEVEKVEEDPNLDFINEMAKKYLGVDEYPYHQPGDERVVMFVRPEHTTGQG